MKKKKILITSLVVLAILAAIIYFKVKSAQEVQRGLPAPTVVVGSPTREEITRYETITGDILPVQQATIYAKVSGNLQRIYADIGSYVKENQVIALIDTTVYVQNLKQAKATLAQAEVNYQNNKISYERNKSLFEQKLIARQDYDNSKAIMDASKAQQEAANANYQNAFIQLSYCKVTAPFSGVITKRLLDPGTYISTGGASVNSSIFVLMNTENLKSLLNIPEKIVPLLNSILEIQVTADALPGKVFKAKLTKTSNSVDLSTRTMQVELMIENPDKSLKPGMFATFKIILEKKPNTLILQKQVELNDETSDYIFVLQPDTTVARRNVKNGIIDNNRVEILSGLSDNDRVIFSGQSLLKDKMKVKITK
jgi:RND family efflux transporter MFP subunit